MNKLFIVGCSRSGTSIIQKSIIASLPLYSLPETGFFSVSNKLKKNRESNLKRLLIYSKLFDEKLIHSFPLESILTSLQLLKIDAYSYVNNCEKEFELFENIMCKATMLSGQQGWVEKTPLHFYRVKELLNNIEGSKVLYVIRNGLDVAASIRHRAIEYPEFKHQSDPDVAIKLWNASVDHYNQIKSNPNVILFEYDKFVLNNETYIAEVISKLGFNFGNTTNRLLTAEDITLSSEGWKSGLNKKIEPQPSRAFDLFNDDEIKYLFDNLKPLESIY